MPERFPFAWRNDRLASRRVIGPPCIAVAGPDTPATRSMRFLPTDRGNGFVDRPGITPRRFGLPYDMMETVWPGFMDPCAGKIPTDCRPAERGREVQGTCVRTDHSIAAGKNR